PAGGRSGAGVLLLLGLRVDLRPDVRGSLLVGDDAGLADALRGRRVRLVRGAGAGGPLQLASAARDLAGDRLLRRGPVPHLHRPAHPAGGLGGRAPAQGGGPGDGGCGAMVIGSAWPLILAFWFQGPAKPPEPEATRAVRQALGKGGYPWYDA